MFPRRFLPVLVAVAVGATLPVAVAGPAAAAPCRLPATPVNETPWALQRLAPNSVWPLTRGKSITVAIVDSGVSVSHPQLRGAVTQALNTLDNTSPAVDIACHGTLVAGIIAGRGAAGAGFTGVAPDASIVSVKALDNIEARPGAEGLIAKGIDAAVAAKVDIVNVSAASDTDSPQLRAAVRKALAADIVVVAAAGNDGGQRNVPMYPAAYPGVLAVGAVAQDGSHAPFSDVQQYVQVAAPGQDIVGPAPEGTGYVASDGTSFAAPYVSGVAALVRAYYPGMKAPEVVRRIVATADRPGTGRNSELGAGVVNPYRAVTALLAKPVTRSTEPPALPPLRETVDPLRGTKIAAVAVTGGLVVLVVLAMLAAAVLPRAQRRRWSPGSG